MTMLVQDVQHVNDQIRILESIISKESLRDEDTKLVMSLPGFEAFSALLVTASISGIERFGKSKQLVSFMGVCPRTHQSGDTTHRGRMKKASDRNLTAVMMHAALVAVRHDAMWKAKYEKLRKRHPPVVALSHIACSLASSIFYMLKRREPYRYHNKTAYDAKIKRIEARIK